MKAHAVIGANFGDCGKGLIVDYLCGEERPDLVVRYCGGAQAGHTVVTPTGQRHVFHHIGSGSFCNIPTFLSKYFLVNPLQFIKEVNDPTTPNIYSRIYVHPDALVTTPFDMLINQAWERKQGRYASCGIGINETMQRSKYPEFVLTVKNMLNTNIITNIFTTYIPMRIQELNLDLTIDSYWIDVYCKHAVRFLNEYALITSKPHVKNIIFEGAQGLLLDQNSSYFPFVTHANTGSKNVREMCDEWGITDIELTYVTRSYLTRHGMGPLPNEQPLPDWLKDDTNVMHEFQGPLRYAPMDDQLAERIAKDADGLPFNVAVTHLDQYDVLPSLPFGVKYRAYGPTCNDVNNY